MTVKFVSYTGSYPCLCMGDLLVEITGMFDIDGTTVTLLNAEVDLGEVKLISGGRCGFDDNGCDYTRKEPWVAIERLPAWIDAGAQKDLLRQINEHVEFGCCGGCL